MITTDQIRQIAVKAQTNETNIRREYLQQLLLRYFYQLDGSDKILFKGGTSLRLVYHSPRFSEDLDFSCLIDQSNEIERLIQETLVQVNRENVGVDITEAKPTIGGYLSIINFEANNQKTSIQLQFSFRLGKSTGELTTVSGDYFPPFIITGLAKSQLIAEKVQALLSRQKPRDFYDLYYILRANLLDVDQRSVLSDVQKVLDQTKLDFDKELKIFLPQSHWLIIRDFKDNLKREIERLI